MYDFDDKYSEIFIEECENCGKQHFISTQEDINPEYYTTVYYKCDCGTSVYFKLPVN